MFSPFSGAFTQVPFTLLQAGRAVFQVSMTPDASFEYYVTDDTGLVWPPGAPSILNTVVVS